MDSLLSGLYLQHLFSWPIVGVYCNYTTLWHIGETASFLNDLKSGCYLAVDLDIHHALIPSVGHHIIHFNSSDLIPGHQRTLNPNSLRGFAINQRFGSKYPLATIHFLRWIFGDNTKNIDSELLCWLADSAFINAQQYKLNVEDWVLNQLPLPAFKDMLPRLQTENFDLLLRSNVLDLLQANPLCKPGKSQYKSQHTGIVGFQCQFENPNAQNKDLQHLWSLLNAFTGWKGLPFPTYFDNFITGSRSEISIPDLVGTGLPFNTWLQQKQVFSYAFIFKHRLNYTTLVV